MEKLREAVDDIRNGVTKAQEAYASVESDLHDALSKMATGVETAGLKDGKA